MLGTLETINCNKPPFLLLAVALIQPDMNHHPCSYVQSIFAGTAEVEDGCIRGVIVGDSGKESVLSVVEILDEVCDFFPALY